MPSQDAHPPELVGCWELIRSEDGAVDLGAEVEFISTGQMVYSIPADDRWQIMKLTWRVEGNEIVSDQPSSPRAERTFFKLEAPDVLILSLGGKQAWFKRGPKRAPAV